MERRKDNRDCWVAPRVMTKIKSTEPAGRMDPHPPPGYWSLGSPSAATVPGGSTLALTLWPPTVRTELYCSECLSHYLPFPSRNILGYIPPSSREGMVVVVKKRGVLHFFAFYIEKLSLIYKVERFSSTGRGRGFK